MTSPSNFIGPELARNSRTLATGPHERLSFARQNALLGCLSSDTMRPEQTACERIELGTRES